MAAKVPTILSVLAVLKRAHFDQDGSHTTMIIYLAHPASPSGNQAVSRAVSDRGLSLLRAKPCDVRISVIPDVVQPGYLNYTHNLPAFMEATLTRKVVDIRNRGYPIGALQKMFPVVLPPLIYDFQSKPNDAKIAKLREHSVVTRGREKSVSFIMQTPTRELLKSVVESGANQTTSHVYGTVNLQGMKCVFILQKILTAFLLTHNYPAFRHANDDGPSESKVEVSVKRRKTSDSSYLMCMSKPEEHLEQIPEEKSEEKEDVTMSDKAGATKDVKLVRAKPSSILEFSWGSIEHLPNASGIYIPFIEELAVEDTITIPSLVSTYFLRCLASTPQGMLMQMETIRSGWSMVASTRTGHELSHMAKCIDVALQAQCFVYPTYTNNVYEGTVICGAGYSIGFRDRVFGPSPYEELQKVVVKNSRHIVSLVEICKAARIEEANDIMTIPDIRSLSMYLKNIQLDEIAKQEIVKHSMNLSFPNKYWSSSPANIGKALALLNDPDSIIPSDIPMYPKYMFTLDRVEQVLSAFGHSAPTFMIPNGRKCYLDTEMPPKNLTARTVTVETAVLDMKYVSTSGYITNNMSNLSSKHKDTPMKGEFKKDIWRALRTYSRSDVNEVDDTEDRVAVGGVSELAIDEGIFD